MPRSYCVRLIFKYAVLAVDSEVSVVRGFYAADDLGIDAE